MLIEQRNIEVLKMSPNDLRTFDYQQRVALPAVDKLRVRLEEALACPNLGDITTAILKKSLLVVSGAIVEYMARQPAQQDLFAA